MKLTKSQRHTAYILMLAELNSDSELSHQGFCWLIKELFTEMLWEDNWESGRTLKWFPELLAKKPSKIQGMGGSWFWTDEEGQSKRKNILQQCIIETY